MVVWTAGRVFIGVSGGVRLIRPLILIVPFLVATILKVTILIVTILKGVFLIEPLLTILKVTILKVARGLSLGVFNILVIGEIISVIICGRRRH